MNNLVSLNPIILKILLIKFFIIVLSNANAQEMQDNQSISENTLQSQLVQDAQSKGQQTMGVDELLTQGYQIEIEYLDGDTTTKNSSTTEKLNTNKVNSEAGQIDEAQLNALKSELEESEKKSVAASQYYLSSQNYFFAKDYGNSLVEINRAIKLKPKTSLYHSMKGSILYKLNNVSSAKKSWEQAVELGSKDPKLQIALEKINRLY